MTEIIEQIRGYLIELEGFKVTKKVTDDEFPKYVLTGIRKWYDDNGDTILKKLDIELLPFTPSEGCVIQIRNNDLRCRFAISKYDFLALREDMVSSYIIDIIHRLMDELGYKFNFWKEGYCIIDF